MSGRPRLSKTIGILGSERSSTDIDLAFGYPLAGLSDAFYCLWVISFVAAIGYLRYVIRHKYEIPAQCCTCDQDGVVDDCCCAFWCGCCATAQIARHEYAIPATGTVKYDCCSATGEP